MYKLNLKLSIYNLLRDGVMPSGISKKLNIKFNALSYHLSLLQKAKFIKRVGYGTWEILKDFDTKELQKYHIQQKEDIYKIVGKKRLKKEVRGHAFIFKIKVPKKINLYSLDNYLTVRKVRHEVLTHGGIKLIVKGKIVHIWSKVIIIYDKNSYITYHAEVAKEEAIYSLLKLLHKLEQLLGMKLTINKKYKFRVRREHYGLMKNIAAKYFNHPRQKIVIADEYGFWFSIDNSYNAEEAEFWKNRDPDENRTTDNTTGFQNLMNEHKKHNWKITPEFILNSFNKQTEMIYKVTENQLIFDKNMSSHLKVLQANAEASKQIAKEVRGLKGIIKNLSK